MTPLLLLILYLCFRAKQFICDYILQTNWMALTKGKAAAEGYRALFTHTAIHAAGTGVIMMVFAPTLWWLALVDFAVHALIDRVKGALTLKKNWKVTDTAFWWALGADQEAHNLTHLAYIVLVVMASGGLVLNA
jgi:Protein of unknown function (DUF3307)